MDENLTREEKIANAQSSLDDIKDSALKLQTERNSGVIDVSKVDDGSTLRVPTPEPQPIPTAPTLDQVLSSINTPSDLQNAQSELVSSIIEGNTTLAGEDDFRAQQNERFGLNDKTSAFNQAVSQFEQNQLERSNIPMVVQEQASGQGQTRFTTNVREADALRVNAIKQNINAANILATQGDLETARGFINDAVSAKYDALERQVNLQQQNLQLITPLVNQEQAKRLQQQQIVLQERSRLLAEEKQVEQAVQNLALNARANGASNEEIQAITNAGTIENAIEIGGNRVVDPQIVLAQNQFTETVKNNAFSQAMASESLNLQKQQIAATNRATQAQQVTQGLIAYGEQEKRNAIAEADMFDGQQTVDNITELIEDPLFGMTFGTISDKFGSFEDRKEFLSGDNNQFDLFKRQKALRAQKTDLMEAQIQNVLSQAKGPQTDGDAQRVRNQMNRIEGGGLSAAEQVEAWTEVAESINNINQKIWDMAQDPILYAQYAIEEEKLNQ